MVHYKATQKQLDDIKEDILKGTKLDEFGNYECGCALNPRYGTINKMCSHHSRGIENAS